MYLILMELYVDYTRSLNKVTKQPKYAENVGSEREWHKTINDKRYSRQEVLKTEQKGNP